MYIQQHTARREKAKFLPTFLCLLILGKQNFALPFENKNPFLASPVGQKKKLWAGHKRENLTHFSLLLLFIFLFCSLSLLGRN